MIAEILAQYSERWRSIDGLEETSLLRLSILRDLVRELHARKSHYLASGSKADALGLKPWEARLDELRNCSPLEGELMALLERKQEARKRTRVLPEAVYNAIPREKLERYDRHWEAALASEAVGLGWRMWALDTQVIIQRVEEWDRKLREQIWPYGVVLLVESAESPGASPSHWHGRWIILLHPRIDSEKKVSVDYEADSAPHWKLLFSPKKR